MYCSNCKRIVDEMTNFCPDCGNRISREIHNISMNKSVFKPKQGLLSWLGYSFKNEFSTARKIGLVFAFLFFFLFGVAYIITGFYGVFIHYMGPEPFLFFLGFCFICTFFLLTIPLSHLESETPHCASCGATNASLKYYLFRAISPRVLCSDCRTGKMKLILVGHLWTCNFWLGPFSFLFWIYDMYKSFSKTSLDIDNSLQILHKLRENIMEKGSREELQMIDKELIKLKSGSTT